MALEKDYNTTRNPLVLKEYGRNIQKLIDFVKAFDDKEKRTKYALTLIQLMRQIAPGGNFTPESEQKFWDDLHIISDMKLDIDSPYPVPELKLLYKKPEPLIFKSHKVKLKHYGRNIELLIQKTVETKDPEKRENAIIYIGKLMKTFQSTWNKDNTDDAVIIKNIQSLSDGQLDIDLEMVTENNLFEVLYKDKGRSSARRNQRSPRSHGSGRSQGGGRGQGGRQSSGRNQHHRRKN